MSRRLSARMPSECWRSLFDALIFGCIDGATRPMTIQSRYLRQPAEGVEIGQHVLRGDSNATPKALPVP